MVRVVYLLCAVASVVADTGSATEQTCGGIPCTAHEASELEVSTMKTSLLQAKSAVAHLAEDEGVFASNSRGTESPMGFLGYLTTEEAPDKSNRKWDIMISPKDDGAYAFAVSSWTGSPRHHTGKFKNFKFNSDTKEFSADVTFDEVSWKGKLDGKDWNGLISMENGHKFKLTAAPCGLDHAKCIAPLVGHATSSYAGLMTSRGSAKTMFGFLISPKIDGDYKFASFLAKDGVTQFETGSLSGYAFDEGAGAFSSDVKFDFKGWTGKLAGTSWNGVITMSNGWQYDLHLLPISEKSYKLPGLSYAAAYTASVVSGADSKLPFVMHFGKKQGSTYSFTAVGFKNSLEKFNGKLENFKLIGNKFSADVVFVGQNWKGHLDGEDWKGKMTMANGWTYSIDVAPQGKLPSSGGEAAAYLGQVTAKHPVHHNSASLVVSHKKDSDTYVFATVGFKDGGCTTTETYLGELQNFEFDTNKKKFKADVVFYSEPWKGKMYGNDWKGKIKMETGYNFDVDLQPFV